MCSLCFKVILDQLHSNIVMQVITRLVHDRCVNVEPKPTLSLIPQSSLQEFWLPLTAFHLDEDAKNGCLRLIVHLV